MEEHIPNYITLGNSNFLKQVATPDKSSTSKGKLPPLVTKNNQIFTTSNGRKHVSIQHIAHSVKYIMLKLKKHNACKIANRIRPSSLQEQEGPPQPSSLSLSSLSKVTTLTHSGQKWQTNKEAHKLRIMVQKIVNIKHPNKPSNQILSFTLV